MKSHKKLADRLTNEMYVSDNLFFTIYLQFIESHVGLHWHEFYELCLVYSGQGVNTVNGQSHSIQQGSLFLLTPADFHEVRPAEGQPLEIYNIVFSREFLSDYVYQLLFDPHRNFNITLDNQIYGRLIAEFMLAWAEWNDKSLGYEVMCKATLERILVYAARVCEPNAPIQSTRRLDINLRKALFFIEHHFREPISLKQAAKAAYLSPNYFSECFRQHTGVTFQRYLVDLRLSFAKSLLVVSDLTITEICFIAGFNTLANFERSFKLKFLKSPSQLRPREQAKL